MENYNNQFENYLLNILYSLDGRLTKGQFTKIVKFYGWSLSFKSIHVVGTNGKSSTSKYINDELIENGYTTGLFISPHLISMYERIRINNRLIDFDIMAKFVSTLKSDFKDVNFSWFDVFFLTALYWFETQKVEVAVFEAGIGAKKDVTNFINHNWVLISSIDLDHEKILGNSIQKIALDKSHAIKKDMVAYIPNTINKDIVDIFQQRAKEQKSKLVTADVENKTYETINQSLCKAFLKNEFNIKKFKSHFFLLPGRSQKETINGFECYLDVGHNYQGIFESMRYYEIHNIDFDQVVVSLSEDKDAKKIFLFLEEKFGTIYVYENKGRKPMKNVNYDQKFPRIHDLKRFLLAINKKTLFIGSFYLISEILQIRGDSNRK